jgi:SAM-dependent methyltransferase
MRAYWDDAARRNAAWYVDTSLDFHHPDMASFFDNGRTIVADALDGMPSQPRGHDLAVEIGSGLGRICLALAERGFDRVVGVDVSPEMVERATQLVTAPTVEFIVGDGHTLAPIADGTVDLLLSFTVFQHIPSTPVILGYLTEAGRTLKPGGVFVFQWNNQPGAARWRVRRAVLSFLQRTRIRGERHGRHAPQFLGSRVPLRVVERALGRAGLELIEVKGAGTLYCWAWATRTA